MNQSQNQSLEFDMLVEAYLDDSLTDSQWEYLAKQATNTDFQQQWQEALALQTVLNLHHHDEVNQALENLSIAQDPQSKVLPWKPLTLVAAVVTMACFITYSLVSPISPGRMSQPHTENQDQLPQKPYAIVLSSSENQMARGSLITNHTFSQDKGWATLQTLDGVSITLQAPFKARLKTQKELTLLEGEARVFIPEGNDPFSVHAAHLRVRSEGSDFGIAHNDDGSQRCRVIKGVANVEYLNTNGSPVQNTKLISSQSIASQPKLQELQALKETDKDYHKLKFPDRDLLPIPGDYAERIAKLSPLGHWRFESIEQGTIKNNTGPAGPLLAMGTANLIEESGGNHSGNLNHPNNCELFTLQKAHELVKNDFSFSLFFQIDWLGNFNLVSASRYDDSVKGYSFLLQTYSDFEILGAGTGIRSVFRQQPAWDGGTDVYGHRLLMPLRWYQITVTRKSDLMTVYLDGQVIGEGLIESGPIDFKQLYFGRISSNPEMTRIHAKGIMGRIDELVLFDRCLSPEEVATLQISP